MEIAHLNQLIALEDRYWWHVSKRRWVTQLLQRHAPPPSRVIEGGIGGAGNLLQWQRLGYSVAGLDCMPESIENAKSLGLEQVYQHDLHDPWPVSERSDAVILLDVLEHLRDPVLALRNAAKCLSDKGRIIFTVPAYPGFSPNGMSDWGIFAGTQHRWCANTLRSRSSVVRTFSLECLHLPVACVLRWVRRVRPTSKGPSFPRWPLDEPNADGSCHARKGHRAKSPHSLWTFLGGGFCKVKRPPIDQAHVAIVMPLLNEAAILPSLVAEIRQSLETVGCRWSMMLVNDGSTDESGDLLEQLADEDVRVKSCTSRGTLDMRQL